MNNQFGYPQPVMPQNNMGYPMYNGLPINQPVYRTQVPQVQPMQMQPSYSVIPGRIVNTPDEIRPNYGMSILEISENILGNTIDIVPRVFDIALK